VLWREMAVKQIDKMDIRLWPLGLSVEDERAIAVRLACGPCLGGVWLDDLGYCFLKEPNPSLSLAERTPNP
jgi:hypothetical protein